MTEELQQGSKLGNYELLLRVGRGGMAAVWVARERAELAKDDRLVAVKVMLTELADETEFIKMFLDEVRVVRSIHHPNVVDVYEVGEHDGMMWMAMEWVEGESLHTVIAEAGKRRAIPAELAVRIIADAAAGLHAAHELCDVDGSLLGVVHRDISPHNILIGTNGVVKLVDFGVAKAIGRVSEATRAGQLKGKFGYMSPEQALGKGVDRRSDIFSLGIVLFELTTSRRLFRGEHDIETLRLVISGAIPQPTQIDAKYPPELERIVQKALERNVSARYQSAAEFEHDLRAYLKSERLIVPQSGIAGLLKRVLGERIEQRRRAVRATLKALSAGKTPGSQLLPNDPAFTPTGKDRLTASGANTISTTGLSGSSISHSSISGSGVSGSGTNGAAPSSGTPPAGDRPSLLTGEPLRSLSPTRIGTASMLGYVIGLTGLAIAVFVLLFMR